jgi:hypothetical protein
LNHADPLAIEDCPNQEDRLNGGREIEKRRSRQKHAQVPADLCQVDISHGGGEDRRMRKDELSIAEFNVEWLFLNGGKGSLACPGLQCPWPDAASAQAHLARVIKKLDELDADIVHLVEVESCQVLEKLRAGLRLGHLYRAYMVPSTDQATGQNCGLLTRLDPIDLLRRTEARRRYHFQENTQKQQPERGRGKKRRDTTGVSKHYMAKFSVPVGDGEDRRYFPLYLVGAHLLARPTDTVRARMREAQATVLSTWLSTRLGQDGYAPEDSPLSRVATEERRHVTEAVGVVLLGDLNDFDDDVPGADNQRPISRVVSILKRKLKLTNVAVQIPQSRRYTAWYDANHDCQEEVALSESSTAILASDCSVEGILRMLKPFPKSLYNKEHSLIDHVLVNDYLLQRVRNVSILNEERVSCRSRTSDHWPTKVVFKLA